MRTCGLWVIFLTVALAGGLTFWYLVDWWYYVIDPIRGPWPKFQAPLWEQLLVSSIVGAFGGGLAVGLVVLVWLARAKCTSRLQ
jgi:hypothetical protein